MFNFYYFPSPKIAFSVSCFMCIDAWNMAEASSYVVYADITVFYVQRGWFSIFGLNDICPVLALPALPSMPSWPAAFVGRNRTQPIWTDLYLVGLVRWHLKTQYWRVNKSAKAGQSAGVFVFFKWCRCRIIKKDNPVNLFDSEKKGGAVHDVSLSSSPARHRQLCSRTVTATSAKSKGKKSKVISS